MTSHAIVARDVNTFTFLTTLVAARWPAPVSGAVHLGRRRLDNRGNIQYRAIVLGNIEGDDEHLEALTPMKVGSSRSSVLLGLLEAVEDLADEYIQYMVGVLKKYDEEEEQEEEGVDHGTAIEGGTKKPRLRLILRRPSRSSSVREDVGMRGFGDDDDGEDGDNLDNIDVQAMTFTRRGGEGRAYINTAQDADSTVADPDDEVEGLEHQRMYKGKGKARADNGRFITRKR